MTSLREIEAFVAAGQKINAIKEVRAMTGMGLFEAKNAVEHFEAHRQWPAGVERGFEAAAAPVPVAAAPAPGAGQGLRAVEQLLAQGQIIAAIKDLRGLTGWGLKDMKDAVDDYRAHGSWPASLLAVVREPAVEPPPVVTHTPPPQPSHAAGTSSAIQAVAHHLGYAPQVLLDARALREKHPGRLVMLRDRTFFVRERAGGGDVELMIPHEDVRRVSIDHDTATVLRVTVGDDTTRFVLQPEDAEAALALFRVFGP